MNRRGFFATLAALAVAPLAGAFNVRPKPRDVLDAPEWRNWTTVFCSVDQAELNRVLRLAMAQTEWRPAPTVPAAAPPRS